MYKLTKEAVEAFKKNRASIRIPVDLVSGDDIAELTEADIKSFKLERDSVSGRSVAIGEARASELTIELENWSGKFDDVNFDGAKIFPRVYVGAHSCPLGYFTIDGHENKSGRIKLTALDRMVLLDREASLTTLLPISVKNLVLRACETCGVDASRAGLETACNGDYEVKSAPEDATTWRQIVMWCCEIMGRCAYIDAEGYFRTGWYEDTGLTITASDRFDHTLFQNDVVCTGVRLIFDDNIIQSGDCDGFTLNIEGNELIDYEDEETRDALVANLGAALNGFRHRPFDAETLPMPNIFPLDGMTYIDTRGEEHFVCITHIEYQLAENTELEGTGESETTSGYAYLNPITKREKRVVSEALKRAEEEAERIADEAEAAAKRMNELIANALGLYLIEVTDENGATTYYFADAPKLEEAHIIYVFNSGGFAWTHDWNDGKPAWEYGVTKDGNAVLNYLTVNNLTADHISVESIVGAINATTGERTLRLSADHIDINGAISANGTFSVDENGFMTATGGNIAGLIIDRTETEEGGIVTVQKSLHTANDEFHILVNENAGGDLLSSEVLITSLICDTITARTGDNSITLCYAEGGVPITASLQVTSWMEGNNLHSGLRVYIYRQGTTEYFNLLSSIRFAIKNTYTNQTYYVSVFKGNSWGFSSAVSYNTLFANYVFAETGTKSFDTISEEDTNRYVAIKGNTLPLETDAFSLGSDQKEWLNGYFKNLFVGGGKITPPSVHTGATITANIRQKASDVGGGETEDCSLSWVEFCGVYFVGITATGDREADDYIYTFDLTSKLGTTFVRCISISATVRVGLNTTLSGNSHDGVLSCGSNGSHLWVGMDTGTTSEGFYLAAVLVKD